MPQYFDGVTLLITHYNRSSSLERLLKSYRHLECSFGGIVVSDDGSKEEHRERLIDLQEEYSFDLVTSVQNKGLGNNINKGQDAVKTPYTLYVQEDFVPAPDFAYHFRNALNMMDERPDFDIVRFYSYLKYPYLRPYKNGFSEMYVYPWSWDYMKIYFYSDHPHLRRSNFFEKFGRYAEGLKGDRTEYQMCISFIRNKGKGLFYDDYKGLFDQKNSGDEPSTMTYRDNWRQSSNLLIKITRDVYRQIKYNYDLLK
jgi:glycosyltransferase involved in cell wall biosynthesis